jgi:5-dehydro-2-deoxygluconokinase
VLAFIGFAAGRSFFWGPLVNYRASKITRDAADARIVASYREWVDLFEKPVLSA